MDKRHALAGVTALLLLAACGQGGSGDDPSGDASGSATPSGAASPAIAGNGAVIVGVDGEDSKTITRYPIAADGTLGAGVELLTGESSFDAFPAVVDGVGDVVATGDFEDYWTTGITVRDAATGAEKSSVKTKQWCGGEGLTYNPCVLVDATTLLRTSTLGDEDAKPATLTLSSLTDGSDIKTLGPFEGLVNVLGTIDPHVVLLTVADEPLGDPPEPKPGKLKKLDLTTGATTDIGVYDADWTPVCALGTDSALGYDAAGDHPASVIGSATVGGVSFGEDDSLSGCSNDGRFVYVQHIPAPPTSEEDDEAANPATTVDRITLADGTREPVQSLEPLVWVQLVTR